MDSWGVRRTVRLAEELRRWRTRRGLSYRAMAPLVACEHSHLWKIEHGKATLTREMAEACDQALDAGGALIAAWVAAQGSVRPAQLPASACLIGRRADHEALQAGMRARPRGMPTVVAIDGPPGVGKTALALRWAHENAEDYVDGQLYADLRGSAAPEHRVATGVVLQQFLTAMGASVIPATTTERAALYRSLVADRRVLVVLDDAADIADVEPLLPATAHCAVVVTSRRPLPGLVASVSATRVTLHPLDEPCAVALISNIIGESRAEAQPDAVAAVARLCGNLPLALRLAAEHLATYPHRPVADLLAELLEEDRRPGALDVIDIRAALRWSYQDLDADAAHLFRVLGLHGGSHLGLPAVAALAGLSRSCARRVVDRLATLHLVEIDADDIVRLPGLIPLYAGECVAQDSGTQYTAGVRRGAHWYLATLQNASQHLEGLVADAVYQVAADGIQPLTFTGRVEAADWCEREWPNLQRITALAQAHGWGGHAAQLTASMNSLAGLADRCDIGIPTGASDALVPIQRITSSVTSGHGGSPLPPGDSDAGRTATGQGLCREVPSP